MPGERAVEDLVDDGEEPSPTKPITMQQRASSPRCRAATPRADRRRRTARAMSTDFDARRRCRRTARPASGRGRSPGRATSRCRGWRRAVKKPTKATAKPSAPKPSVAELVGRHDQQDERDDPRQRPATARSDQHVLADAHGRGLDGPLTEPSARAGPSSTTVIERRAAASIVLDAGTRRRATIWSRSVGAVR